MKKIAVFLVDDHEIFRNGLKQLINNEPDIEVAGEAATGEDAIEMLSKTTVDVIIMDIRMPGISGLDTGKSVLKDNSKARLLFFSLFDNPDYVLTALDMGASGYILKDTSNKIFLHAIRTVHNGQFYFIGDVTDTLVRKYHEQRLISPESAATPLAETSLSKREQQIIRMIDQGVTNKEIAENLGISIRTIEAHRLNILRKFQVSTIEEAVENARAFSLLA
ncbi:response regulator [Dyadobacter frigoris]|uniref:Response regulator transcription factor n=1 Tax=Dyadobacter frigoris TaxID=2576211 RepID=A0A4V6BI81_9BACT|nr:response regulator transcription factor [Dyadobacter frigoris]TKT89293.1 response regulator transcription factor [Dyadobacter frigoris]GLU57071.1 DNA-binding response regulator [Dyadobacter frigoris]